MTKPVPGSYIDTQGMGGPMSPEDAAKAKKQKHKPAIVTPVSYTHLTLPTNREV